MLKVGEYVVYKRDVCFIKEIKKNFLNHLDYVVLVLKKDESLKIEIPVTSKEIRNLLTKEEIKKIIKNMPKIKMISVEEKQLEQEYKRLLKEGTHENLIKIIKTAYLRNEKRILNKRKIGDKDNYFLELAERDLYYEFGTVLNLNLEQTKEYIKNAIEKQEK